MKFGIRKKLYRKSNNSSSTSLFVEEVETTCPKCKISAFQQDIYRNYGKCPNCHKHMYISALERINYFCDKNSFEELDYDMTSTDPLDFEGYKEKLKKDKENTGLEEAVVTGIGKVSGQQCVIAVMDSKFRMGSMGKVVGEKITRATEKAREIKVPFIIFTASGGARMQEGMISLMQMAKTSAAFHRLNEEGILSIVILTNPTTGGVAASFATLADILLAEPNALIGFAGKKVIEQTVNANLPEGFQTAEFLFEKGHIDDIVDRSRQRDYLSKLIKLHTEVAKQAWNHSNRKVQMRKEVSGYNNLTSKEKFLLVRNQQRPRSSQYIKYLFDDFIELHGDRFTGDDGAIITGIATYHGRPVTIIAHERGADLEENLKRNFGMPRPSGFKKAIRIVEQSRKFKRPIITFVDTKGADPTAESESENQSAAISNCLMAMLRVNVPSIAVVIGEGGSGGALALAVCNKILMLENSIFSVISPEGAATILWKNKENINEAIKNLKITASDLEELGIIDEIIPEVKLDSEEHISEQSMLVDSYIMKALVELDEIKNCELYNLRIQKYRNI